MSACSVSAQLRRPAPLYCLSAALASAGLSTVGSSVTMTSPLRFIPCRKQRGIKLSVTPGEAEADDDQDLLGDPDYRSLFSRAATEASGEARAGSVVLDDNGVLHWPLLFLYPEHGQTDFICAASEESR